MNGPADTLTDLERRTLATYETNAAGWSAVRSGDPDFWAAELDVLARRVPSGRALDVGSGNGRDARLLGGRGYQVDGIDISESLLALARRAYPPGRFRHASVYELPFPDGTFDIVWAAAVLLHLPKPRVGEALSEMRRVMAGRSGAFVAVKRGEGERVVDDGTGERFFAFYELDELNDAFAAAGLRITEQAVKSRFGTDWLCLWATPARSASPQGPESFA